MMKKLVITAVTLILALCLLLSNCSIFKSSSTSDITQLPFTTTQSSVPTAHSNLSGSWAGNWLADDGTTGTETLQITDDGSGNLKGVWGGGLNETGQWLNQTNFELSGQNTTSTLHDQGYVLGNTLVLYYTSTGSGESDNYTGVEILTRGTTPVTAAAALDNVGGNWIGTWTNSLGESGNNDTLQITDDGSGDLEGVWSGNIDITGGWDDETDIDFSGQNSTRAYQVQGSFIGNMLVLNYTATRLDTSGTYTGVELLTLVTP
jgi:hypothetical protein